MPLPDHLKLHLPLGMSASLLAYGALTWEAGYRTADMWDTAVRNLDWVASYLVKCHYMASDTPSANAFVAQVGSGALTPLASCRTETASAFPRPRTPPRKRLLSRLPVAGIAVHSS